jgi:hypothetical protein
VQSAIELRPGVEFLTLRCVSCGLVYDAQVPSDPTKFMTSANEKPRGWVEISGGSRLIVTKTIEFQKHKSVT